MTLDEHGEPIYGERDQIDLSKFRELGIPFWLAGSFGTQERLGEALAAGACGVQIGTAFAFCEESGIQDEIKCEVVRRSLEGHSNVFTDPLASPTGFPFKVYDYPLSVSDSEVLHQRERICDLGYLREAFIRPDGKVGFRCAGEPCDDYVAKGGKREATDGRICVCNGLLATVGLGQVRKGIPEPVLVTAGNDVQNLGRYVRPGATRYTAAEVLNVILRETTPS